MILDGIVDDIDFDSCQHSKQLDQNPKNQFQMDASTATIFLKLVGHTRLLGDFTVYTAGNFPEEETKHSSYGMLICHSEI